MTDDELQKHKQQVKERQEKLDQIKSESGKSVEADIKKFGTPQEKLDLELKNKKEEWAQKTEAHNKAVSDFDKQNKAQNSAAKPQEAKDSRLARQDFSKAQFADSEQGQKKLQSIRENASRDMTPEQKEAHGKNINEKIKSLLERMQQRLKEKSQAEDSQKNKPKLNK